MSFDIKIDDTKFREYMASANPRIQEAISKGVAKTTAIGLRIVVENLPKRSGNLRGSYQTRMMSKFHGKIFSESQYAYNVEFGSGHKTIVPKRAKMLTIPLRDSVLTPTRSQIRKSALTELFSKLKNKGNRSAKDIFNEVGIVLAKKANIPAIKGKHTVEKSVPAIEKVSVYTLETEIMGAL